MGSQSTVVLPNTRVLTVGLVLGISTRCYQVTWYLVLEVPWY